MEKLPAEVFAPGEYVADELAEREWSLAEFAAQIGRSESWLGDLIEGRVEVTDEVAACLADAFGTSAAVWINLESAYRAQLRTAGR